MDVPGGVGHQDTELTQHLELEVPQVTLDPLRRHQLGALLGPEDTLLLPPHRHRLLPPQPAPRLRLLHLVVNVLAGVHVETRVEEGAVPQRLVRVGLEDLDEVQLLAGLPGSVDSTALALEK